MYVQVPQFPNPPRLCGRNRLLDQLLMRIITFTLCCSPQSSSRYRYLPPVLEASSTTPPQSLEWLEAASLDRYSVTRWELDTSPDSAEFRKEEQVKPSHVDA